MVPVLRTRPCFSRRCPAKRSLNPSRGSPGFNAARQSSELRQAITQRLGRGATLLHGQGAWSGKDKQVILCVVKPPQIARLRALVQEIDESAFFVVSDARGVYGKGFENLQQED